MSPVAKFLLFLLCLTKLDAFHLWRVHYAITAIPPLPLLQMTLIRVFKFCKAAFLKSCSNMYAVSGPISGGP